MRKIFMTIIVCLIFLSGVTASIGLGAYDEAREISKVYRDELLSQTEAVEINPNISISCNDDYCMWSATQSGIISSSNNRFDRDYCSEMNETISECVTYTDYTDAEIQDMVADAVQTRLENYADASIERKADVLEVFGTGNLEITEKK